MDQNEQKWIELDRSVLNGLKWTELDSNRPNWTKWTAFWTDIISLL